MLTLLQIVGVMYLAVILLGVALSPLFFGENGPFNYDDLYIGVLINLVPVTVVFILLMDSFKV